MDLEILWDWYSGLCYIIHLKIFSVLVCMFVCINFVFVYIFNSF